MQTEDFRFEFSFEGNGQLSPILYASQEDLKMGFWGILVDNSNLLKFLDDLVPQIETSHAVTLTFMKDNVLSYSYEQIYSSWEKNFSLKEDYFSEAEMGI